MDPRARKILFGIFAAILVLVGVIALARSGDGSTPAAPPSGGAAPPRPAPTDSGAVLEPPAKVKQYLERYFAFTWQTPVDKWEASLIEIGATGDALEPPFVGASLDTCVRTECGYRDVTVSDVKAMENGTYTADVEATFSQSQGQETRGTWACTVDVTGSRITAQTCLGVA